jgi:hypothetical protein
MGSVFSFATLFACGLAVAFIVAMGMQDAATRPPPNLSNAALGIPAHTATF